MNDIYNSSQLLLLGKGNRGKQTAPAALSQAPPQRQHSNENYIHAPQPHSPIRTSNISDLQDQENSRLEKFGKLLSGPTTDLGNSFLFLGTGVGVSNLFHHFSLVTLLDWLDF